MDRIVREPTGKVDHIVTTLDVNYTEKTDATYSEVHILPDTHVPVKEVS
jgi:hypothetical protein